ncbi:MAG: C-terminal processing protease CtpA/Prc [Pseudohongiellaceae bacterium]|jgi:C-terminal processing protease CtpA/Prc
MRQELGLPSSSEVRLTLGAEQGQQTLDVTLPVSASRPLYGEWPQTMSGFLGEDVGYLRIHDMFSPDQVPDLDERLHSPMGLLP